MQAKGGSPEAQTRQCFPEARSPAPRFSNEWMRRDHQASCSPHYAGKTNRPGLLPGTSNPAKRVIGTSKTRLEASGYGSAPSQPILIAMVTIPARRHPRLVQSLPVIVVLATVLLNLWVLRGELTPAQNVNDASHHISMIRWASQRLSDGHVPLDGWYPYTSMGLPQFHMYQTLPHVLSAFPAILFGADTVYRWTLYLLLATWPLSVYCGSRLLSLERWPSAIAAAVAPLMASAPGLGFEDASYIWRGLGVWTQLWGCWLLPIAMGLSFRAIVKGNSQAIAAVAVALTFACNFITGYFAFLLLPVWALASNKDRIRNLWRAAGVCLGAFAAGSWVIVPLLSDKSWTNRTELFEGFWRDSYGLRRVVRWLMSGSLFDRQLDGFLVTTDNHFPVVTLLVAVGLVVCVARFRRDEEARSLVVVWLVSIALLSGRATLGRVVDLLPGSGDLFFHRFILAVQITALPLAGIGGAQIGRLLRGGRARSLFLRRPSIATALVAILALGSATPAWAHRISFNAQSADLIREQASADGDAQHVIQLINHAKEKGDGRIYAGTSFNWGMSTKIMWVRLYSVLLNNDADVIGFNFRGIQSLSHDVETRFDENNPSHYELFNVRYLLLPHERAPAVDAEPIKTEGKFTLWRVNTSGYLSVVDSLGSIEADRTNLGVATAQFLKSLTHQTPYPVVNFAGRTAHAPQKRLSSSDPPGRVLRTLAKPSDGKFVSTVDVQRPSLVLLKATFHPRWEVTVDGKPSQPMMIAPSFVGVPVAPGRHSVSFVYQPFKYYWLMFAFGISTLFALETVRRFGNRSVHRLCGELPN